MSNNENYNGSDLENSDAEWGYLRKEIKEKLTLSPNPNSKNVNENDLTETDLLMWEKYKQYLATGEGLTLTEFRDYSAEVFAQENASRGLFRGYMVDHLNNLFYPEGKIK
ncbi:MAG: hypothetical protein QG665_137 [Patescibacteria group bacterium]|nr:hypothetical protein [Patescibacteria group bacterium]